MKPKTANLVQVNIAVLIWGGTAMFPKGLDLPIRHIVCLRSLISVAALLLFMLALKTPIRVKHARHYGVMAVLGILLCLHWLTYFQALRVSSAAVAVLSLQTYPVFTALIEPFLFGEKLKKTDIALAALVFAGVLIMTPALSLSNNITQGILLGVFSGLLFMFRNLLTRKYVQVYSGSMLMFWQVLVAGIVLIPMLFVGPEQIEYPPRTLGLLLLLGVFFTALPQTLFAASHKHLSARTVGIFATLLPFYAAFFAYFIHDETVTLRTVIGGLLILACVMVETAKSVNGAK